MIHLADLLAPRVIELGQLSDLEAAVEAEEFDAEKLEQIREKLGLNLPLYQQFGRWISAVLVGKVDALGVGAAPCEDREDALRARGTLVRERAAKGLLQASMAALKAGMDNSATA